MAQDKAEQLAKMAMQNIKQDDYVHRGFLKPIEIALKTAKTERNVGGDQLILPFLPISKPKKFDKLDTRSLPFGLKILVPSPWRGKQLKDLEPIEDGQTYKDLKDRGQDNILTLMKKKNQKTKAESEGQERENSDQEWTKGIKLAICVCMYSQNKTMLKKTLAGVSENIANLVAYEGINPDDIGVFVIMDGIEYVDESIVGYFEELERGCNIILGDNSAPTLSLAQINHRRQTMTDEEINEQEMKNVNNYLFDPAELEERNKLRFQAVRKAYFEKKELLDYANRLKQGSKKLSYDDLNQPLQGFFLQEAKIMRKKDYNLTDEELKELAPSVIIEDYINDIRRTRPMIASAIQRAVQHCQAYLNGKEDLAYLGCFRKTIRFSVETVHNSSWKNQKATDLTSGKIISEELADEAYEGDTQGPSTIMNLFLCVKYKNGRKLSSHNWFFNGFCKELKPQFSILLDVGLQPQGTSLVKMYKYMKEYPNIGGVCGYMSLKIQKIDAGQQVADEDVDFLTSIANKFVDIQRTQQVEYHFAHLIDKPFEAAFKFIHVLPGAFSAYNMSAILDYDKDEDDELLVHYFKSIDEKLATRKIVQNKLGVANTLLRVALPDAVNGHCIKLDPQSDEAMLYNENVYLAEDRILCMGIHKKGFDMAFLPDAYAEVDPMKNVHELLGQRKRWINGSYFAFEKVKKEFTEFNEKQNRCSFALNLQIFYLTFMNSISYFSPALFMFTVHIAIEAFRQDVLSRWLSSAVSATVLDFFVYTMDFVYVMMIASILFYSLHFKNSAKQFKSKIYLVSTLMGIFMVIIISILMVDIVRGLISNTSCTFSSICRFADAIPQSLINWLRYLLIASVGIYFIPIALYWFLFSHVHPLCEVLLGYVSFLFYSPTYLNILNIYSLCRIDDISWGTKGLDSEASGTNGAVKGGWKLLKFVHVFKYVLWNIIVSAVLLTLGSSYQTRFWVTFGMVVMIGGSVGLKVLISLAYMVLYKIRAPKIENQPRINDRSRIRRKMKQFYPEIRRQIQENLSSIKVQFVALSHIGSMIQSSAQQSQQQTIGLSSLFSTFCKQDKIKEDQEENRHQNTSKSRFKMIENTANSGDSQPSMKLQKVESIESIPSLSKGGSDKELINQRKGSFQSLARSQLQLVMKQDTKLDEQKPTANKGKIRRKK